MAGKQAMAHELLRFLDAACTPYHAVDVASRMLREAGCVQLHERDDWHTTLARGGRYFVTRNGSSLVAFAVGGAGTRGAKVVGAHTDSPNLALKPRAMSASGGSNKASDAYVRVGVQCYGGGLWHTWFDRDLTVAGRIVRRTRPSNNDNSSNSTHGALATQLVRIDKPLLRISSLAPHLRTQAERDAFAPNKEQHLVPILATAIYEKLARTASGEHDAAPLLRAVALAAGCDVGDIVDFDLSVIDTQPSALGGVHDEFVYAPRLDNLLSCFCALRAFVQAEGIADDDMARVVCLFDHEEVGSTSAHGAAGSLLPDVIERLRTAACAASTTTNNVSTTRATFAAQSFLLSVDGAHASHPCYGDKHEDAHRPLLHGGPVIKYNANVRYATTGATAAVVKLLAQRAGVPVQEFVVRNDSPCGSTIGPMLSALTGVQTADIGNAMLSMHSIREMCGVDDVDSLTRLITAFFTDYCSDMLVE